MKNLLLFCCAVSMAFASCKKDKRPTPTDPIPTCTLIGYVDSFSNGKTYPYTITRENGKITKIEGHGLLKEFAYNGNNIHIKTLISQTVTGQYYYHEDSVLLNSNGMIDVQYRRQRTFDPVTGTYPMDASYVRMAYSYTGDQIQKIEVYYYDKNTGIESPVGVSEFVWENGNCTKWSYTSNGAKDVHSIYTYDTAKTANALDYLNAKQIMEMGALYIKNKNRISSLNDSYNNEFEYTFDKHNKITTIQTTKTYPNSQEKIILSRRYQYNCN